MTDPAPRPPSHRRPTRSQAGRALERNVTPARRQAKARILRARRALLMRKDPAHLIHIGKTAGTAIKAALAPVTTAGRYEIQLHDHRTTLRHLPRGEKVFFVLRDPVQRYVSAFNSRLREGRPRYEVPWTPEERIAFAEFRSADQLACALSDPDSAVRTRALTAMSSILHVRDSLWRWLIDGAVLQRRRQDVLCIIWLPDLEAAFPRLCEALELPEPPILPTDDVGAHRSPANANRFISDRGAENLGRWYARDYGCIEICSRFDTFVGPSYRSEDLGPRAALA